MHVFDEIAATNLYVARAKLCRRSDPNQMSCRASVNKTWMVGSGSYFPCFNRPLLNILLIAKDPKHSVHVSEISTLEGYSTNHPPGLDVQYNKCDRANDWWRVFSNFASLLSIHVIHVDRLFRTCEKKSGEEGDLWSRLASPQLKKRFATL